MAPPTAAAANISSTTKGESDARPRTATTDRLCSTPPTATSLIHDTSRTTTTMNAITAAKHPSIQRTTRATGSADKRSPKTPFPENNTDTNTTSIPAAVAATAGVAVAVTPPPPAKSSSSKSSNIMEAEQSLATAALEAYTRSHRAGGPSVSVTPKKRRRQSPRCSTGTATSSLGFAPESDATTRKKPANYMAKRTKQRGTDSQKEEVDDSGPTFSSSNKKKKKTQIHPDTHGESDTDNNNNNKEYFQALGPLRMTFLSEFRSRDIKASAADPTNSRSRSSSSNGMIVAPRSGGSAHAFESHPQQQQHHPSFSSFLESSNSVSFEALLQSLAPTTVSLAAMNTTPSIFTNNMATMAATIASGPSFPNNNNSIHNALYWTAVGGGGGGGGDVQPWYPTSPLVSGADTVGDADLATMTTLTATTALPTLYQLQVQQLQHQLQQQVQTQLPLATSATNTNSAAIATALQSLYTPALLETTTTLSPTTTTPFAASPGAASAVSLPAAYYAAAAATSHASSLIEIPLSNPAMALALSNQAASAAAAAAAVALRALPPAPPTKSLSAKAMKALYMEFLTFQLNLPVTASSSIFVRVSESRLDLIRALITGTSTS